MTATQSLAIANTVQVLIIVAAIAAAILIRRSNKKLHKQVEAARRQDLAAES